MLRFLLSLVCTVVLFTTHTATTSAQSASTSPATQQPPISDTLSGIFYNEEIGLNLHLNLAKENLLVPNMEFLGSVRAYMDGRIYGVWMLISYEVKDGKVLLRFTNDIGSDSQDVELSQTPDGHYFYRTLGGNNVRRVVGRKLVKIADSMPMKRKPLPTSHN